MADVSQIMGAFRAHLIDAGIVRRPSEPGPEPPMFVSPIDGAPAPGEREGVENNAALMLSLLYSSDVAPATAYDAAISGRHVLDVRYRSASAEARRMGMALSAEVTRSLINPSTNYGYGFMLGGLWVLEVNVAGGGPISSSADRGFDDVVKYLVEAPRS